jgi:hypothetical protein
MSASPIGLLVLDADRPPQETSTANAIMVINETMTAVRIIEITEPRM